MSLMNLRNSRKKVWYRNISVILCSDRYVHLSLKRRAVQLFRLEVISWSVQRGWMSLRKNGLCSLFSVWLMEQEQWLWMMISLFSDFLSLTDSNTSSFRLNKPSRTCGFFSNRNQLYNSLSLFLGNFEVAFVWLTFTFYKLADKTC